MRTTTLLIALLLAMTGTAAAQTGGGCPECDEDGPENAHNSYSDADLGVVANEAEALADADVASAHTNNPSGPWAWLSVCLSAVAHAVNELLGTDLEADAHADVFVSTHGVDVDANVGDTTFDASAVGGLDDASWSTLGDANAQLDEAGVTPRWHELPEAEAPAADVDACVTGDVHLADCS